MDHLDTPIREDAFQMDDQEKIDRIEEHMKGILQIIGMDLTDDSLKDTPRRVAKMYINEIFSGLNPKNKPAITLFENKYKYKQMLVEKDISVFSTCEHHLVPFFISFPSASGRTRDEKKRSKPARRCKGQARQAGKNQGCFRFSSYLLIF
jgi:hypothetical protein